MERRNSLYFSHLSGSLKLPPKQHFKHFFTFFKCKNDSPAFDRFKHCSDRLQLEG